MTIYEGISLGGLVGVLTFLWRIADSNKKKVSYDAFDRHKEQMDKRFMSKELCSERSEHMVRDLNEIKSDIKKLLGRNGIR